MSPFSVLLSVYDKESPDHLNRCFRSLAEQHVQADEVVVVEDGLLPPALHRVIKAWREKIRITSVPLTKNVGLGRALQRGLEACSYDLIARMDSDDISHPERFAKQVAFMDQHPEIDVVGTWISEFEGSETNIYAFRKLPVSPSTLATFARKRNPLNHMSVMFRKDRVIAAGSYQPFLGFEDYFLWERMLINGSLIANIPEFLVNVRAGNSQLKRRGGLTYAYNELKLQKEFLKSGFINHIEWIENILIRFTTRLLPDVGKKFVYKLIRSIKPDT